ncbi:MAG: transcriptional regulator [Bacteroidales bacterium]|jgi:DNA-binding transcriptional ArsR family regulator|nr:transcriptional regulator [Bacteroidales bacterium]
MKDDIDFKEIIAVNKLIHEPARMAVISLLSVVEEADFIFIMNSTGLTQGNLSSHLAKLEEAGYVEIEKTFRGKRPHTLIRLTGSGLNELTLYLKTVKRFLYNI